MDTPVSCRGSPSSANTPTGFVSWVPSAGFEPASTRGHKEENPIKTRGRYDLPLIPTKAYRQADLSITASRKHGIGLPATLGYVHSDGSGRSVSDMPFGQDGTATQGVRRIYGGYEKGSNQVTSV